MWARANSLTALDCQTGKLVWTEALNADEQGPAGRLTLSEGALVARIGQTLAAHDTATGKRLWNYAPPSGMAGFGAQLVVNGRDIMAGQLPESDAGSMAVVGGSVCVDAGEKILAVAAKSGKENWTFKPEPKKEENANTTGNVGGGMVIAGGGGNMQIQVRMVAVANGNGVVTYSEGMNGRSVTPPLAADGIIFAGFFDGLYAVDAKTQKPVWKYATSGPVVGRPAIRDGVIYFYVAKEANNPAAGADLCALRLTLDAKGGN